MNVHSQTTTGRRSLSLLTQLRGALLRIALGASLAFAAQAQVHAQAAQLAAPSEPMRASVANQDKRFSTRSASFVSSQQPSVQRMLPAVTEKEFALVAKRAKPGVKALRVGIVRELSAHRAAINLRDLVWTRAPDGNWLSKLQISSAGAQGLRVELANGKDTNAALLQFRLAGSAAPQLVEGPFLVGDFKSSEIWSAWTQGESITLEATLPAAANPFELSLAIKRVSHLDKDLLNLQKLGTCHRDVVCETGATEIAASATVARYIYNSGGSTFTCTGTLMNDNDASTVKMHFLSALHCLSTAAEAATVTTLWYDQVSSCGGTTRDSRYQQVGGGADITATGTDQDMLLMQLRGTAPASAQLAGWNANPLTGNPVLMVTHHPAGGYKKISRGSFNGFGEWEVAGQNTHISVLYNQGSTEQGSSGSTIRTLDGSWIVRGTLSGGNASCTDTSADDRFGRLDLATAVVAVLAAGGSNPPPPPPPPTPTDIAGSTSTTATIASGGSANSTIDSAGDQDWFRISLTAGTTYTFKMDGSSAGAGGGTLNDPFLRLLNSSGTELVTNDDISQSNLNSQIVYLPTVSGTYYLSAQAFRTDTGTYRLSVTSAAPPPPPPPPPAGFTPQTGWWWDSGAGGQGFGIEILNGKLFIGGFLYDNIGNPIWFVSNGAMRSSTVYFGTMTQYYSGQTLTGGFISPSSSTTHGGVLITFTSATTATMDWPGGTKQLSRFPIVGSTVIAPAANMPQRGWYVSPGEPGRGWMVEVQGDKLFMAGFMYNNNGYPIWYLTAGTMTNANFYSGIWQNYGLGQTYTSAWASPGATLTNANAGSLTLNFGTSTTGSLTLPNGRIIPLVRFTDF